jgi:hypothetical protein
MNALRHGLLSKEVLVPGEDEEALRELTEALRKELQPVGALENILVGRIIFAYWKLQRLRRIEAGIFAWERLAELAELAEREAHEYERSSSINEDPLAPYVEITDKGKHEEALSRARQMRSEQEDETARLGRTFARDTHTANAFSKLARYASAADREFYRALHELERRQAARRGGSIPPRTSSTSRDSPMAGAERFGFVARSWV